MTENTEPAGERQDPADVKRVDTEVETEPQGDPQPEGIPDPPPSTETVVEHSEETQELRVTSEPTED